MNLRLHRILLLVLVLVPCAVWAEEIPPDVGPQDLALWEFGVGGGAGLIPDYPAAGQSHWHGLPFPYLVYRGAIVRADREGARMRFIRSDWADLEMSFSASFSADSDENDARRGMPDLDYLFEMGPRVTVKLSELGGYGRLRLFLPMRAAFATDFGTFKHQGWTSTPALYARMKMGKKAGQFCVLMLTSSFADRPMNAYFYDVAPAFSTPSRPAYDARAGYMGTDASVVFGVPAFKRARFFLASQILLHSGSANADSPLFKNQVNYSFGTGMSWALYYSKKPATLE